MVENRLNMAQSDLRKVRRLADRVRECEAELRQAILAARQSGETLQDIGTAAGLSRQRVHQIVRSAPVQE